MLIIKYARIVLLIFKVRQCMDKYRERKSDVMAQTLGPLHAHARDMHYAQISVKLSIGIFRSKSKKPMFLLTLPERYSVSFVREQNVCTELVFAELLKRQCCNAD